jgi:TolB-like protein/Tfp pilus assembly protein PilF
MAFWAELKRRRVGKVAIAYGAIAWAVTEASSVVLPALRLPDWTITFIVVFLLVGFPVAMILAWIFDVGPTGIERTEPLGSAPPAMRLRVRAAYGLVVLALMGGLGYLLYERGLGRAFAADTRDSIAVLPFANLSGDPAQEYFSDGMSEELLNLLARVPGLQVAARTSSFAYKGKTIDIREVGRELGVATVLEGSVRQSGNRVRITAQLIDTRTGFHLWSEAYDGELKDIFTVQDEISGAIVTQLKLELKPEQQLAVQRDKAPTSNVQAYELYLQGRAAWKKRGAENLLRAVELYQQAISRDPAFARAHAALASAYVVLPGYTPEDDFDQFTALAERSARQALTLDANIGEAHAVLAQLAANRGQLLDAESGFFFAISLEPLEATPHHWYSMLLARVGRLDAALEQARRAQELDTSGPVLALNLANMHLMRAEHEQATRYAGLAEDLGMDASHQGIHATVAQREQRYDDMLVAIQKQQLPEAIRRFVPEYVAALRDPARRPVAVARMRAIPPATFKQQDLIQGYLQLGQVDLVYSILQKRLVEDPEAWHDWDIVVAWGPEGAAFRRDPRFAALAERVGLVQYWKQYGYPDGCKAGTERSVECT